MSEATATVELDGQYRALREEAGLVDRSTRGKLLLRGDDAADYLQSQVTNEIETLEPGQGCYAALLDRKGHLVADMRVLVLEGEGNGIWLDTEPAGLEPLRFQLETYKIGRDVEIADESGEWALASLIGPAAAHVAGVGIPSPEHAQTYLERDGIEILAAATDLGLDLIVRSENAGRLRDLLLEAGAVEASEEAAEILRIESGRPRFGADFDTSLMPAEAGIVERAIDFEKGCYIGQEPVARLHYKGKPNRHLRGLRLSAAAGHGDPLRFGDKEVGAVGTACVSPRLGPIALAVVRREAEPGSTLAVGTNGTSAEVVELPFD